MEKLLSKAGYTLTPLASRRYTLPMKRTRIISVLVPVLALLSILLAACGSGSLGNEEIAFVRDGNIWTVDPSGASPFEAVAQSTPVLGYGLSPDHQIFVFRVLDGDFSKTPAARHLTANPVTGLVGDVPGALNTIGIDGGTPIPLTLSTPNLARSNAWWSPDGNRLLYREGALSTLASPDLVSWWMAQNDQPAGIARKFLPNSYSIPSIDTGSQHVLGNSSQGVFTTTLAGSHFTFVQHSALTGHPLPASLERLLWQPAHQNPSVLLALPLATAQENGSEEVRLILWQPDGQMRTLANCACRQFAWSPDGNQVLYNTNQDYTVLNIQDGTSFRFIAEHGAVPYWSPHSRALLLDGLHTLTLVQIAARQVQVLLNDDNVPVLTDGPLPGNVAFLQPVANSLWNVDGQRFVIATRGRMHWQGQLLRTGDGLYVVNLNNQGVPQGTPVLVDKNSHDTQPGWSYINPNTSFLF